MVKNHSYYFFRALKPGLTALDQAFNCPGASHSQQGCGILASGDVRMGVGGVQGRLGKTNGWAASGVPL